MDLPGRESFKVPQKKIRNSRKSKISFGSILILSKCSSTKNHSISLHLTVVFSFLIIAALSVGGMIYGAVSVVNNISNIFSVRLEKVKNDKLQISDRIVDDCLSNFITGIHYSENEQMDYDYKRERPAVDDGICRAGMSLLPVDRKIEAVINTIPDIKSISNNYSGHALLSAFLANYKNTLSKSPQFICPTIGIISSGYGVRSDPIYEGAAIHNGLDIADNFNAPVFCASSGVVLWSGYRGRWGNVVIVDHMYSGYQTIYAHLRKTAVVGGATVESGQLIGYVGSTGRSTGPHLHYEVRFHGKPVNPVPFILPAGAVSD
jgi:hypothetical protein